MDFFEIISIFLMFFGIVMIIKPSLIYKLNRWGNKIIFTDSEFFSSPKISGILFIIVGIIIIYLGYRINNIVLSINL